MQNFTELEKGKIIACLDIIDELIAGKFILFDVKASKLLKCIASSEYLYGLFAKCLMDYDFSRDICLGEEYRRLQGRFKVPEDNDLLAFVFCLCLEVNNGKINLQSFVDKNFFSPSGYNYSYLNFAREVLSPFKATLMQCLGVEEGIEDNSNEGEQITMDIDNNISQNDNKILFANLLFALNELHAKVTEDRKINKDIKSEEYIVMMGLIEAVRIENIKIINALIIPLEYILGKQKSVRDEYNEVKNCMIAIYESYHK